MLLPLIPLLGLFIAIVFIVKIGLEHRTKQKLIEKGLVDEKVKYLYGQNGRMRALSALKWALVLIGIGLAVIIGQLVPDHMMEEITAAGMFLLAGIGLLVYYAIASREDSRGER
jgi:cytosine/uracil/thiamine/allantoin permease